MLKVVILSKEDVFKKLYNRAKISADELDIFTNLRYKSFC